MRVGLRMGGPWSLKLYVLIVAMTLGATGALVVAQASPTNLNWGPMSTTQAPPGREFAAMTFDSVRSRTVLFGGGTAAFTNLNDTWEFDGSAWVQRTPSTSPPALVGSAMAYYTNKRVSVMFGGTMPAGASSDTWEWDGTNWNLISLATKPSARFWTTMAYDPNRGQVVLFGGEGPGSTDLGDTWVYDGLTWTRMSPANSPTPRFGAAMAFDPVLGQVVLFGGRVAGQRMADTWEWNGTDWTQFTPSSTPFPRFWHSMAFDPQVGRMVLFGGDHIEPFGLGPTNDTWEWDGTNWTQDWTSTTPSARAGQTMNLDANGRVVMFGGSDEGNPGVFPTDTQELGTGIVTPPGNPSTNLPASMDFGSIVVGSSSSPAAQLVFNSGTGRLLATFSTTGDFALASGTYCPNAPNPLAAGMICRLFITFTPAAGGDRNGALLLTGNVPGGSQTVHLHGIGLASDFSISASPINLGTLQGTAVTTTISTAVVGQPGTIALSFLSTDPGLTATFAPTSVAAGSSSTMTIVVGPAVPLGLQGIEAVGTEGLISHNVEVFVTVNSPPPDFSITASPSNLTMVQGDTATSTISTALVAGIADAISLSAASSPAGLSVTLSPAVVSAGSASTLRLSTAYGTAAGTYVVTVSGTEGSRTHSVELAVTVTLKGIVNGGFETGDFTGWTKTGVVAIVKTPHNGVFSARVGSTSPSGNSTLSQTFSVPAAGGKLSVWYRMTCRDTLKYDWFTVSLRDNATGVTLNLMHPICSNNGTWTHVTISASPHAGHSVTLTFLNHDDGETNNPTYTLVDDVSLA